MRLVMEKKRFVSWRRCSTQKQGKSGLGLEAQAAIINYFVNEASGELIADFNEVYTGKNLHGCIELQKAMEFAKKNNATLVIAKSDRFRNLEQALEVYRLMEGNIYFCDVPMAEDKATYKFMLSLSWSLAEREAAIVSLRTRQALAAKRARGESVGNPNAVVTASMRENSIATRKQDARLNDNNRKAYKLTMFLRQQDKSFAEIARELNDGGYVTSTGKHWQTVQVQRLVALYESSI
jgi:DNA invertase Pin-like site-specific DNA recombinase